MKKYMWGAIIIVSIAGCYPNSDELGMIKGRLEKLEQQQQQLVQQLGDLEKGFRSVGTEANTLKSDYGALKIDVATLKTDVGKVNAMMEAHKQLHDKLRRIPARKTEPAEEPDLSDPDTD
jgi:chromosome segregation ATPase